jgi:Sigma-54 interaction domain/Flavin reductase like domain
MMLPFWSRSPVEVAIAVENALDYEKAIKDRDKGTRQRRYLEEDIRADFAEIIGESPALKTALSLVSVVAPPDSRVLILGETGTGKELIARAIHNLSNRRERAFVKLNLQEVVAIVTVGRGPDRTGFTATSVESSSAKPPRLLLSVSEDSSSWKQLQKIPLFRSPHLQPIRSTNCSICRDVHL